MSLNNWYNLIDKYSEIVIIVPECEKGHTKGYTTAGVSFRVAFFLLRETVSCEIKKCSAWIRAG